MKTQEEIVARMRLVENTDLLGFEREALMDGLDFDHARPWLIDEAKPEQWGPKGDDEAYVRQQAREYMDFALGKAEDHRGISANRSILKYKGWLWILDLYDEIDWDNWGQYGVGILKQICEKLGIYDATWARQSNQTLLGRMAEGLQCREGGCDEGCG